MYETFNCEIHISYVWSKKNDDRCIVKFIRTVHILTFCVDQKQWIHNYLLAAVNMHSGILRVYSILNLNGVQPNLT